MSPKRRAIVLGCVLFSFAALLALGGASAWCDESRFGLFLVATPAPSDVPAVDFTVEHAEAYPDVQLALSAVGTPVRAQDPESARDFLERLAEENIAAVHVREGNFYVAGYEQVPSERWTRVCQ